jgi:hypothetical protein
MTTKTKRIKINSVYPPREIRENTKERRAWLANKLLDINNTPGLEGKIVQSGSYQNISVYKVEEVEGRLRHRGSCQFCGNSQVVKDTVLVLHGYERPGWGHIYGRCPGVDLQPLNVSKDATTVWLAQAIEEVAETEKRLLEARTAKELAIDALYDSTSSLSEDVRRVGWLQKPKLRHNALLDEQKQYKEELSVWKINFPVHAASSEAETRFALARQANWDAKEKERHFNYLLESEVFGTPLQEEVV